MEISLVLGVLGIILGGGALGFVQFLIARKDNSLEKKIDNRFDKVDVKLDEFKQELKNLDRKVDDSNAKQARVRILRFSDEVQSGRKFSKDSYNQALDDISEYKAHCDKYKDFPNDRAASAMGNIRKVYDEGLAQERQGVHVFL